MIPEIKEKLQAAVDSLRAVRYAMDDLSKSGFKPDLVAPYNHIEKELPYLVRALRLVLQDMENVERKKGGMRTTEPWVDLEDSVDHVVTKLLEGH